MRSKAHTAPTAPLVLHRIRIHECAMKKFGINGQMRDKLFMIIIFRFSLVKAAMAAACVCKLSNGVNLNFFFFQLPIGRTKTIAHFSFAERSSFWSLYRRIYDCKLRYNFFLSKCAMNILHSYLNCCIIGNYEDLSNEPNFSWIHLAGQYL